MYITDNISLYVNNIFSIHNDIFNEKKILIVSKQGRKRPLDTPKRMIERREREKGKRRDIEREGEIRERER